jgi:hypothetical protein
MAYTDTQIKIIHEQAKARPGYKYVTKEGKVYKGTPNNRLMLVAGVDPIAIKKEIKINKELSELYKIINQPNIESYFSLDENADLTPDSLVNNTNTSLFVLDINTGDLAPSEAIVEDTFFTLLGNEITPKIL